MFSLLTILLSLAAFYNCQPAICPDKCNATTGSTCITYNLGFDAVSSSSVSCWFNAYITNAGSFLPGLTFTNQNLSVSGSLPNSVVNLNGGSTSSTSYNGAWTTTAGSGCGNVFVSGAIVQGPFAQDTTFTWCGVFQSNTQFATPLTWSIGAACYASPSFPTSVPNGFKVRASSGCPSGLPAGMFVPRDWFISSFSLLGTPTDFFTGVACTPGTAGCTVLGGTHFTPEGNDPGIFLDSLFFFFYFLLWFSSLISWLETRDKLVHRSLAIVL
jgi:hypothetical protein